MSDDNDLPEISEHTTINELADIVRRLDQSLTLRIYDEGNQVFGAIRLISLRILIKWTVCISSSLYQCSLTNKIQ